MMATSSMTAPLLVVVFAATVQRFAWCERPLLVESRAEVESRADADANNPRRQAGIHKEAHLPKRVQSKHLALEPGFGGVERGASLHQIASDSTGPAGGGGASFKEKASTDAGAAVKGLMDAEDARNKETVAAGEKEFTKLSTELAEAKKQFETHLATLTQEVTKQVDTVKAGVGADFEKMTESIKAGQDALKKLESSHNDEKIGPAKTALENAVNALGAENDKRAEKMRTAMGEMTKADADLKEGDKQGAPANK